MVFITVKKKCNINAKEYQIGDKYKIAMSEIKLVNKLNENGFIEPLSEQELKKIFCSKKYKNKDGE